MGIQTISLGFVLNIFILNEMSTSCKSIQVTNQKVKNVQVWSRFIVEMREKYLILHRKIDLYTISQTSVSFSQIVWYSTCATHQKITLSKWIKLNSAYNISRYFEFLLFILYSTTNDLILCYGGLDLDNIIENSQIHTIIYRHIVWSIVQKKIIMAFDWPSLSCNSTLF